MNTPDRLITIAELAEALTVSVPTVRVWIRRGKIPRHCYIKVAQTYRFDLAAIHQALKIDPEPPRTDPDAPVQLELDFNQPRPTAFVLDDDTDDNL